MKNRLLPISWFFVLILPLSLSAQRQLTDQEKLLKGFHSIESQQLYDWVDELASEKYGGRLTGTEGYNKSAAWLVDKLEGWGVAPGWRDGTFYQPFVIPYTLVFPECYLSLQLKSGDDLIEKKYVYEDEFIPGSTSGSGEITAEVVYVGYGITAPELHYDDYKVVDVHGKIVLVEREVPVSTRSGAEVFNKWRPYSFHQYKLKNAVKHGAAGMIYNYGPIVNPNNAYNAAFMYSHVGPAVVSDMFSGTGKKHEEVLRYIKEVLKPSSFNTGKTVTIKNRTEHHPEGQGANILGVITGSDPKLRNEVIMLGGHLDHLGYCYEMIPGANDNASAVAVMMAVAKAIHESGLTFKRSILFNFFGAEEQAVVGSDVYLKDPAFPLENTVCLLNMDGVGAGHSLSCLAGKNYPELYQFLDTANNSYVHRTMRASHFANLARPRLDAARFLRAGVPSVSFSAWGTENYYHVTRDNIDIITPEIMEDLAGILFMAIAEMADAEELEFRK